MVCSASAPFFSTFCRWKVVDDRVEDGRRLFRISGGEAHGEDARAGWLFHRREGVAQPGNHVFQGGLGQPEPCAGARLQAGHEQDELSAVSKGCLSPHANLALEQRGPFLVEQAVLSLPRPRQGPTSAPGRRCAPARAPARSHAPTRSQVPTRSHRRNQASGSSKVWTSISSPPQAYSSLPNQGLETPEPP